MACFIGYGQSSNEWVKTHLCSGRLTRKRFELDTKNNLKFAAKDIDHPTPIKLIICYSKVERVKKLSLRFVTHDGLRRAVLSPP